jgi:hypothetical protein
MDANMLFILLNFAVSFFSDIGLNILHRAHIRQLKIINALEPYFKNKGVFESATYAGITVVVVLVIVMGIFKIIQNVYTPNNIREILIFLLIAFLVGYLADVFIDKYKVFGNTLDDYYREAGSGFWGGIAFVFSIIISLLILYYK